MIYKYCGFSEYSIDNIRNSNLFFSTPESFNDPFDSYPNINIDSENERKALGEIMRENGVDKGFFDQTSNAFLTKLALINDRAPLSNVKHGITCFTSKDDNILMWSHYGNKHSGYCLGFDVDTSLNNAHNFIEYNDNMMKGKFISISYASNDEMVERPRLRYGGATNVQNMLSCKSSEWAYEQEIRLYFYSLENRFPNILNYKKETLKEFIIGNRFDVGNLIAIYNAGVLNNLCVSIMLLDFHKYKLNKISINNEDLARLIGALNQLYKISHTVLKSYDEINRLRKNHLSMNKIVRRWRALLEKMPVSFFFYIGEIREVIRLIEAICSNDYSGMSHEERCNGTLILNKMIDYIDKTS